MSPAMVSSPLHNTFAEAKTGRGSPMPSSSRPASGRARQNSTQSAIDNSRRPASSASNKVNGAPDLGVVVAATGRTVTEVKATMRESASNAKGEHMIEGTGNDEGDLKGGLVVGSRKDSLLKREDIELNGDAMSANTPSITTKSGRASKPSTPAIPSFPEPVRSRSSRGALEAIGTNKRSHKKGAGAAAQLLAAQAADEEAVDGAHGDDEDEAIDADEPTYCYCNGVSYGEMVACDYDGCQKEWFHLECVGLKTAPGKGESTPKCSTKKH